MSILESVRKSADAEASASVAAVLSGVRALLHEGLARLAESRRARRNTRFLYRLSDRELKDIGLTRLDLGPLARAPARPGD